MVNLQSTRAFCLHCSLARNARVRRHKYRDVALHVAKIFSTKALHSKLCLDSSCGVSNLIIYDNLWFCQYRALCLLIALIINIFPPCLQNVTEIENVFIYIKECSMQTRKHHHTFAHSTTSSVLGASQPILSKQEP